MITGPLFQKCPYSRDPRREYRLHPALTRLVDQLGTEARELEAAGVIGWGAPIPSFGDFSQARVATLGLNPSNREFVDERGYELEGGSRRFHTLRSLGVRAWSEVGATHLEKIVESCADYFVSNPYDRWFRRLDEVLSGIGASFYESLSNACHLDLIPYATNRKWTDLSGAQRATLLEVGRDTLGLLLRDSSIEVLILNGRSVVDRFQQVTDVLLERETIPNCSLPRAQGRSVIGIGYSGTIETIHGLDLGRSVLVLGYNHNLQSSFGVTASAVHHLRLWIACRSEVLHL